MSLSGLCLYRLCSVQVRSFLGCVLSRLRPSPGYVWPGFVCTGYFLSGFVCPGCVLAPTGGMAIACSINIVGTDVALTNFTGTGMDGWESGPLNWK